MGLQAHGLEISGEAIKQGHEKIDNDLELKKIKDKIHLAQGSMTNLPYQDGSFKAIISNATLQCIEREEREQAFSEVSRALEDDGLFYLHVQSRPKKKGESRYFTKEQIEKLAKENSLEIENIDEIITDDEKFEDDKRGMWTIVFRKKKD